MISQRKIFGEHPVRHKNIEKEKDKKNDVIRKYKQRSNKVLNECLEFQMYMYHYYFTKL